MNNGYRSDPSDPETDPNARAEYVSSSRVGPQRTHGDVTNHSQEIAPLHHAVGAGPSNGAETSAPWKPGRYATANPVDRLYQVTALATQILAIHGVHGEEDFIDTPMRWAKMLEEFFVHTDEDLVKVLKNGFAAPKEAGMVIQQNIPFRGLCPHHLLPVFGRAAIGYIPRDRVVGLSKLARIVEVAGTIRPDTQESITGKIADALFDHLKPQGVIVYIRAMHTCMAVRGVAAPDVYTSTSVVKGVYRDVPSARQEFFSIIGTHGAT